MVTITAQEFAENVGLALLLGAVVGLERELRARDAGMRTNALVAAGAAVFTMVARIFGDSGPLAAQIISGIGFMGAGNILKSGEHVKGLTTAATLWSVAGMGMVSGTGHPGYALIAFGGVMIVNMVLLPLDHWLLNHHITPGEEKARPQRPTPPAAE
jgi:putative Mg2+ transporter-C (MgtC) family protein